MKLKWFVIAALVVCAVPLVAIAGAAIWLATADFRALAERSATDSLERQVSIGALSIAWGDPLTIDLRDLRIANAPWGSRPDMVTAEHIFARIDARALLHGDVRYQRLDISKLVVLLERDGNGIGNWKFGGGGGGGSIGGIAIVPKDRSQFPTLLDFTLEDGNITYRTSSGKALDIALHQVAINATGDDQPITITAEGAYNTLPVAVNAGTDSFAMLRQATKPFGTSFALANETSAINFRGTLMQPLDFDGVDGAMTIETKRLGELLKAFDAGLAADFPMSVAGTFTRSGDHWKLADAKGSLADNAFGGSFALDEGPRGGTDRLAMTLSFDRLVLDALLGKPDPAKPADFGKSELDLPGKQSPAIAADISAHRFQYRKMQLSQLHLSGKLAPGSVAIDELKFAFADSVLRAKATAKQVGAATNIAATAALLDANIVDLMKAFGITTSEISGKIDARADLEMTGATLDQALATSQGQAILAMSEGKVSRDVLEKASTDLRTLFRKGEGMSRIDCLLGVAEIRNGVATLSPLVLRSPDAELIGAGKVDLRSGKLDLTIKSNPKSTGFFALDIPIRVSGPFAKLSAGTDSKAEFNGDPPLPSLPAPMQQLVDRSGCRG